MEDQHEWTGVFKDLNNNFDKLQQTLTHLRQEQHWQPFTVNIPLQNAVPFIAFKNPVLLRRYSCTNTGANCQFELRDGVGGLVRVTMAETLNSKCNSDTHIYFAQSIVLTAIGSGFAANDELILSGEILQ